MAKRIQFFLLLTFLCFSFSYAQQVGDVCTNPAIANLCGSNSFSVNTVNFKDDVSSWTCNGNTVYTSGVDIYYQINLPVSSYQPVNLYAVLGGYFPNCNYCNNRIYFLWFESSPCSSNPVAVNSFAINGSSFLHDSLIVSYPVTNAQSQYYLVIDFTNGNNFGNYFYNLQLGFTNNQPLPAPDCSSAPAPYKGTLSLDQSNCYTSSNPYNLPLSALDDNIADSNMLIPTSLNQHIKYLPINDDNGNGFILTIKTTEINYYGYGYPNYDEQEIYHSFDQFPFTYSGGSNYGSGIQYTYDVALTVFFKNNGGASGIKGFRIQVPDGYNYNYNPNYYESAVPATGTPGFYDPTGDWDVDYDANTNTYTWLFDGSNGRGDNTDNSGYSCKVYTFDGKFSALKDINAWYLPDNYGNDSLNCVYGPSVPARTDCGLPPTNNGQDWIPLGGSLAGGGITGETCGSTLQLDGGPELDQCYDYNQYYYDNSYVTFDDNGCASETDYYYDEQSADFIINDYTFNSGGIIDGWACIGNPYQLVLSGTGDYLDYSPYYYYELTPTILVHLNDTTGLYNPVDSSGNIIYSESFDYYSYFNPITDIPAYPGSSSTTSFTIPLTVPGTYSLMYTIDQYFYYGGGSSSYYQAYCYPGTLIISDLTSYVSLTSSVDSVICKGSNISLKASGSNYYSWAPDSIITNDLYDNSLAYSSPLTTSTYTVIGTDVNGCISSATTVVQVKDCNPVIPVAAFNSIDTLCNSGCLSITNTSTGNPTSWEWSFTGGSPSSFNGQTPSNICYSTPGNYTIRLIVGNNNGTDTTIKTIVVKNCKPTASFTAADSVCNANCVTVTNSSSGNATSWQWSFTGGAPSTYSGQTPPNVCYNNTGSYSIRLIVSNSSGSDTSIKTIVVKNCLPSASFSANDTICRTDCITITNTSSANSTAWQWLFPGGNPSAYSGQAPPNICYNGAGTYTAELIASNSHGYDTAYQTIYVNSCFPIGGFIKGADSVCAGGCTGFSNTSSVNSLNWNWSFDGGLPATYNGQNPPDVCYQNGGQYTVQLIVSNSYGSDTVYRNIQVNKVSAGVVTATLDEVCEGTPVRFTLVDNTGNIQWQSSDTSIGFTDIQNMNDVSYRDPSVIHDLYVRVVSETGNCSDTSSVFKVSVFPPITVSFTWKDSGINESFTSIVNLPDSLTYSWDFGDGSAVSKEANPVHTFSGSDSSYYVCLTIYTNANCSYTFCDHVKAGIATGTYQLKQNEIQIYPDPVSDYLFIKAPGKTIRNIQLYDVLGREIINKEMGKDYPVSNVLRLDVSGIMDGMYYIRIKTNGADYIQNVVKIR